MRCVFHCLVIERLEKDDKLLRIYAPGLLWHELRLDQGSAFSDCGPDDMQRSTVH
jgi:hypothetical protein